MNTTNEQNGNGDLYYINSDYEPLIMLYDECGQREAEYFANELKYKQVPFKDLFKKSYQFSIVRIVDTDIQIPIREVEGVDSDV